MLSRVAENLFWLARYLERAENTARLLAANYYAAAAAPFGRDTPDQMREHWLRLVSATGDPDRFRDAWGEPDEQNVARWMAFDLDNPTSVRNSLQSARENARRGVRYHLNLEMWEALNGAYLRLFGEGEQVLEEERLFEYCRTVRDTSHLFFGIGGATLPRDIGWHFLEAGRHLERADNMLRALQLHYAGAADGDPVVGQFQSWGFLKSVGAYEAYRKRFRNVVDAARIGEFLLADEAFPRSVRASCAHLHEHLEKLVGLNPGTFRDAARQAGLLSARLEYLRGADQVLVDGDPSCDELLAELSGISNQVADIYFIHGPDPTQYVAQG
jgi:uncharacterized alpha-E superfamily protein